MPYPYTPPPFLTSQTVEVIHKRMMDAMPSDIDKSELQIPWDFTRPAALEKAEFVQFELNETIKLIFPHWAYDNWLDLHAQLEGIKRRPSNKASGCLTVRARPGTTVAQGFLFATPANLTASVIFEATETVTFDGKPDGKGLITATIPIQAVDGGRGGNVPPDAIILMVKPDSNISYVTNPEATTGGVPEENDDDLRERVLDAIRRGISWTGCDADYVRWAKEVPGVGNAVTDAEWAGPGTVRLFVIDANGIPANQQILDAVYDYIISPANRLERRAPIGAILTVTAPAPLYLDITAKVTLGINENLSTITERYKANLDKYWLEATTENDIYDVYTGLAQNYIRYVYVGATLAETAGIADYDNETLTVNGGKTNIPIALGEFPVTREVNLYE